MIMNSLIGAIRPNKGINSMNKETILTIVGLLLTVGICSGAQSQKICEPQEAQACEVEAKVDPADAVLKLLNDKTHKLEYYQGKIEYRTVQPLFESETVRKGDLYYAKLDDKKSKLRINFQTLKRDDEKEEKYIEQYIFDGVWLTQINYQIKAVKKYQLTEPNKPLDAFEVTSNNIPLIGFTKIEHLKKDFEITLVGQKDEKRSTFFQLHLKVKPNSRYKDDYTSLDFWIDKKLGLPTKIVAASTEEDVYVIRFLKPRINKKISMKTFDFKIPKDFGEPEIFPLKKKDK